MENFIMRFYPDSVFYFGLLMAFIASCFSSAGVSAWWLVPLILGWSLVFLHMTSLKINISKVFDEYVDKLIGEIK